MEHAFTAAGSTDFVVRKATRAERESILELAGRIFFNQSGQWYADRSWFRLSPEAFDPRVYWVACLGHQIVGVASFRPFTLSAPGVRLPWVGVGAVCTAPEHRGRGIMTALLRAGIREVDRGGAPVSILWGDRRRYGRFGWEQAGSQLQVELSLRHFADPGWSEDEVGQFAGAGRRSLVPEGLGWKIRQIQEGGGVRVREPAEQLGLLARPGTRTFWTRGRAAAAGGAYVVLDERSGSILEMEGAAESLVGLIGWIAVRRPAKRLQATLGPQPSLAQREVIGRADHISIRPTGMVRIHNLAGALAHFEAWWASRPRTGSGQLLLVMEEGGSEIERVGLRWSAAAVEVLRLGHGENLAGAPVVRADRRGMTRLVFGPLPPELAIPLPPGAPSLRELFPLPLYVPPLERV